MKIKISSPIILLGLCLMLTASRLACNQNTIQPAPDCLKKKEITPTPVPDPIANWAANLAITPKWPGIGETFLSTSGITYSASVGVDPNLNNTVSWTFKDANFPSEKSTGFPESYIGSEYTFMPKPHYTPVPVGVPYSGTGRGYPLEYEIRAMLAQGNKLDFATAKIKQNNPAELRQEYLDFSIDMADVPDIQTFDTWVPTGAVANLLRRGNDADHSVCTRHAQWIVWDLTVKVGKICIGYNSEIQESFPIASGYRCPAGNRRIGSTAINSEHLSGYACDWDAGENTEEKSRKNWEIAKFIIGHRFEYNIGRVILYDQNHVLYWHDIEEYHEKGIPANYDSKPNGAIFVNGHVDWKWGWDYIPAE